MALTFLPSPSSLPCDFAGPLPTPEFAHVTWVCQRDVSEGDTCTSLIKCWRVSLLRSLLCLSCERARLACCRMRGEQQPHSSPSATGHQPREVTATDRDQKKLLAEPRLITEPLT